MIDLLGFITRLAVYAVSYHRGDLKTETTTNHRGSTLLKVHSKLTFQLLPLHLVTALQTLDVSFIPSFMSLSRKMEVKPVLVNQLEKETQSFTNGAFTL